MKAVLFDLNDTLLTADAEKRETVIKKRLKIIAHPSATIEWLKSIRKKYFHELTTGAIDKHEYWELALFELGVKDDALVKKLAEIKSFASRPQLDALPALDYVRKHNILVGILANSGPVNEEEVKLFFKQYVDSASYSHITGFRKPHRRAYESLCENLKVKPTECVFVSDEIYEDLWGAKRLGMKTALVKRSNRQGIFSVNPEWHIIEPDFESDNLLELIKKFVI